MAHIVQVGVGSGGMPVLDMIARDERVIHVTVIEPDVYKPHNVVRHLFPASAIGLRKVDLAREWLLERRPGLVVDVLPVDLLAAEAQPAIEAAIQSCDLGICAADNEPAKYHFDALMRRYGKPWTLGEVLSGGIGGFVHWFVPGGSCYGCVASHLQRPTNPDYKEVERPVTPDYSQPGGALAETTIPANRASIQAIAALHALITLDLLTKVLEARSASEGTPSLALRASTFDPGFTTLLLTLQKVPGVFEEAFKVYRFRVQRSPDCLICRCETQPASAAELDAALDQALARLTDG